MGQPKEASGLISTDDVRRYYSPDVEQPFLPQDGIRLVPVIAGASGYRDVVQIADGFEMVVGDVRHGQSATITIAEQAVIKFHFRLSGTGRAALEGDREVNIPERCSILLMHPDGIRKKEWFFAGQHERSVTLLCAPAFLRQRLSSVVGRLPEPVRDYLKGRTDRAHQQLLPLRADMARAAAALLACELNGALRQLYAQAKAYELLALTVQSLIDMEARMDRRQIALTTADEGRVQTARQMLELSFLEPPKIAELAEAVGMNEAKLMRTFKQIFGSTIFEFSQGLKMERAKKLLETSELSVTEIAFEVGYEYSSNFTTAFKRHFGITPKAARDAANP